MQQKIKSLTLSSLAALTCLVGVAPAQAHVQRHHHHHGNGHRVRRHNHCHNHKNAGYSHCHTHAHGNGVRHHGTGNYWHGLDVFRPSHGHRRGHHHHYAPGFQIWLDF